MSDMSDFERPWPRFTAASAVRRREVDPTAPWPRWGSLPDRSMPASVPAAEFEGAPQAEPQSAPTIAEPAIGPVAERVADRTSAPRAPESLDAATPPEAVRARVIPRAQSTGAQSTALVPVRQSREVALVDVARAVRRASPMIAVASVAAVAAMAFFRRR